MWQHRWAAWGGILGATASCLAKIALSTDDGAPLQWAEDSLCRPYNLEFDEVFYRSVYRLLGELMIKYRVNLMPYFQWYRRTLLEAPALALHVFEVDWCKSLFWVPRVITFVLMLVLNAYMIAAFLKGMQVSGSVVGTAVTTASNFIMSTLWGAVVWQERFAPAWWVGFACVLCGVLLLSSVQATPPDESSTINSNAEPLKYGSSSTTPNSVSRKYGKAVSVAKAQSTNPYQPPPRRSVTHLDPYSKFNVSSSSPSSTGPQSHSPVHSNGPRHANIQPNMKRIKRLKKMISPLEDRSFSYECPLCEDPLFDTKSGEATLAIADMSPSCHHILHARCLKHQQKLAKKTGQADASCCPICHKTIPMFMSSKQAAHFGAFWISKVEACLKDLGPAPNQQPLPAEEVRKHLKNDSCLTEVQRQYVDDDPNGLGKGLADALSWGGSIDYNEVQKGHKGWNKCLETRGIWRYDQRTDTVWLWGWGKVHPQQRCEQCQISSNGKAATKLTISCSLCAGSAEAAQYCGDACFKRDRVRHKMSCQRWQNQGPNGKT